MLVILPLVSSTLLAQVDTTQIVNTSNTEDSIIVRPKENPKKSSFNLQHQLKYDAVDSTIMDWKYQKAYLYKNGMVEYGAIILKADYIEIDLKLNTVYAKGMPDSTGKIVGLPVFKDGDDEYTTDSLHYNFNTKKGLVNNVTKKEGEAYVWISEGKKMPDNTMYVLNGHFTTCDAGHPHFRIKYTKGKVIPNDKIVTGPIFLEIEDVTLPLALPFGFFPNKRGRANGILIPTYGYTENRGYHLKDGGYYWGLGPHADLSIRGEIFSRGSWGLSGASRYKLNYKYNGNINVSFNNNKFGDPQSPDFYKIKTFNIQWQHAQDPKANPNSNFSASVNFGSSKHAQLNSTNLQDRLNSNYASSISYTARLWQNYNLGIDLSQRQNNYTREMTLNTPSLTFSTPRYKPFERIKKIGQKTWYSNFYQNLQLGANINAQNQINTYDSLILKSKLSDFSNGIIGRVPISTNVNLGFFNWNTSAEVTNRVYFKTITKYYQSDTITIDTINIMPHEVVTSQNGVFTSLEYNLSTSISSRIYGMFIFKKGPIKAIRHVLTPNLALNYRPDFGLNKYDYYRSSIGANNVEIKYSKFEGSIYGSPSSGKSGSISLSVDNNFEMKVKSKKDTITGDKKVMLIESASFSTSYNMAVQEFNLAPLSLRMRTTLFKKVSVNFNAIWDFYALDTTGKRINEFYWKTNKKLLRPESFNYYFSMDYSLSPDKLKGKEKPKDLQSQSGTNEELDLINQNRDKYVDFNNPWNLTSGFYYSKNYTFNFKENKFTNNWSMTLNLNGDINITKKWKIGVRTGYDFFMKAMSPTSIDIYRDLHCWEMSFNWIPSGYYKSYNLTIRAKSSILQDLKLNKKRDWKDY